MVTAHDPTKATVDLVKQCRECGATKTIDRFHSSKANKDGRRTMCIQCMSAANKRWRHANPERVRKMAREWRAKNIEKERARWKPMQKDKRRQNSKRQRDNLCSHYIRSRLVAGTKITRAQLKPELIEMKREELRLRRLAKTLRQASIEGLKK